MTTLIVIPTPKEYIHFCQACSRIDIELVDEQIGRLACTRTRDSRLYVACGRLGKVQFGISTQHLIDCGPKWETVVCAGAAGRLVDTLSIGDIVVGTETVEYDIQNYFGPPLMPRFPSAMRVLQRCREMATEQKWPFNIQFGPIASGDQDVVDVQTRRGITERTNALGVAWEGAGGARACQFCDVPFVEIRGISDGADAAAPSSYENNLALVMMHLAIYLLAL